MYSGCTGPGTLLTMQLNSGLSAKRVVTRRPTRASVAGGVFLLMSVSSRAPTAWVTSLVLVVSASTASRRASGSAICVPIGSIIKEMLLPVVWRSEASLRVLTGAAAISEVLGSSPLASR